MLKMKKINQKLIVENLLKEKIQYFLRMNDQVNSRFVLLLRWMEIITAAERRKKFAAISIWI
jgi:hypothetical protein